MVISYALVSMCEIQNNSYFQMRSEWLNIKHIIGDMKEVYNQWLLITIIIIYSHQCS